MIVNEKLVHSWTIWLSLILGNLAAVNTVSEEIVVYSARNQHLIKPVFELCTLSRRDFMHPESLRWWILFRELLIFLKTMVTNASSMPYLSTWEKEASVFAGRERLRQDHCFALHRRIRNPALRGANILYTFFYRCSQTGLQDNLSDEKWNHFIPSFRRIQHSLRSS